MTGVPRGGAFLTDETPHASIRVPEELDAECRMMSEAASNFLRGEVLPLADALQDHPPGVMAGLLRSAANLGLLGIDIPEAYGGLGLSKSVSARIAEALAPEPSFAVSHNVHTSVATLPVLFFGTPEQKERYLPRLASGELIGAYALSESHAGSDALALRTRADISPDGHFYRLHGEKMWITNAAFAGIFVVFAKTGGDALTAFLVESDAPGVSVGREEHKLGLKGSSTCRLILEDVRVPATNRLGEPGDGGKVALYTLNIGRFKIAAGAVGQSKNLLRIATRYAKQRMAFGRSIAEFGLVREKLAWMAARIFAAESMLYRVAGYLDAAFGPIDAHDPLSNVAYQKAAQEYAIECALLKVFGTETLDYCADECLQIHGGNGFTEEFPAARAWRDARVSRIYEGTNEINRLNVSQILLRRIERGTLQIGETPFVADSGPPTTGDYRAILQNVIVAAKGHLPDVATDQETLGAVADIVIELFAEESMHHRWGVMMQMGVAEQKVVNAFRARNLMRLKGMRDVNDRVFAIFSEIKEGLDTEFARNMARQFGINKRGQFTDQRDLAMAVIEADGYIW